MFSPETVIKRLDRVDEFVVKKDTMKELTEIIQLCKKELDKHPEEVSMSALQVGRKKRLFVVRFNDEYRTFVNPMVQKTENLKFVVENSILTGKQFLMPRYEHIAIAYQSGTGVPSSNIFSDPAAISIILQNIDLLDGICDEIIGLEVDDDFLSASDDEKAEVIKMFAESLKESNSELNLEIESDEVLKSIKTNIDFNTAVAKGEVTLDLQKQEKPNLNRRMRRFIQRISRRMNKKK